MQAWLLERPGDLATGPLRLGDVAGPASASGDGVVVRIAAATVDATDLAVVEGAIPITRFPVVAGHAAAGVVESTGGLASRWRLGDRVAVFRLRSSCGACAACLADDGHLCRDRKELGVHADGTWAERVAVPESALVGIPDSLSDAAAASLAGEGVLGYRAARRLRLPATGARVGVLGYGTAGVVAQLVARAGRAAVFVFTRSAPHRQIARDLGAEWAGAIEDHPATAEPLDAVISLGIAGRVLPAALRHLRPGGALAFAAAALGESLPALDYARHLDRERSISSVSSAPRRDLVSLFALAATDESVRVETETYAFESAPEALDAVKSNRVRGAAVISLRR